MKYGIPHIYGLLAALAVPAAAHHGTAMYDMQVQNVLDGQVVEWRWSQPHTWLTLEVPASDGRIEVWSIESGPLGYMRRQGWTESTLQEGDPVTVTVSPLRDGSMAGILREIRWGDGQVLVLRRP